MATDQITQDNGSGQEFDLKAFCRNLDSIYAELLDQNVAIEAMVELLHKEDLHPGISVMLRSIRENISEQLEQLDASGDRLRASNGMTSPWEVTE